MSYVKSHAQFVNKINTRFGDAYTVVGEYKNSTERVLIRHNICEYEWNVFPNNLFSGKSKCPRCSGKERPTTSEFKKRVKSLTRDEYEVIGKYVSAYTKIKIRHKLCQYEWDITPTSFINVGARCPRCQDRERYTTEDINEKIRKATNYEYEIMNEYLNNYTPMYFKHNRCSGIFEMSLTRFLYHNNRCPICYPDSIKISNGEKLVSEFLMSANVLYKREYTFSDCKDIRILPFDFGVVDKFGSLICLIEYDGEQHFMSIEYFGGKETLQEIKKRDEIKNKYCEKNNIPLLRIPYYKDYEMKELLFDFLIKCKVINGE